MRAPRCGGCGGVWADLVAPRKALEMCGMATHVGRGPTGVGRRERSCGFWELFLPARRAASVLGGFPPRTGVQAPQQLLQPQVLGAFPPCSWGCYVLGTFPPRTGCRHRDNPSRPHALGAFPPSSWSGQRSGSFSSQLVELLPFWEVFIPERWREHRSKPSRPHALGAFPPSS